MQDGGFTNKPAFFLNAYLSSPAWFFVGNDGRVVFSAFFLLFAVFAYDISLDAPSSARTYESWTLDAFVEDGGAPVPYPSCTVMLRHDGLDYGPYSMEALSDRARHTEQFDDTGSYGVNVTCGNSSAGMEVQVSPNSQLALGISSADSVGDTLQITADYEDLFGSDITTAACTAHIYVDGELFQSISMYYNYVDSAYYVSAVIEASGDYEVEATCSAPGYFQLSRSEYFSISKNPVVVNVESSSLSGYYGSTVATSLSFYPQSAVCTSNYGNLVRSASNSYTFRMDLDFVGVRQVAVTCSATDFLSTSKIISVTSSTLPTTLSVTASPEYPFSFQQYYLTPLFWDKYGNEVQGASCTVRVDNETSAVPSFQPAGFQAPAGPAGQHIRVACSKTGYESAEITAVLNIRPIPLSGVLEYAQNVKQSEPFEVRVALKPGVAGTCTLNGRIISRTGVLEGKIEDKTIDVLGQGVFRLQTELSGTFKFNVECSSPGYTPVEKTGEIEITVLSRSEELSATIILTILTAILAVGFVLIRRYL